MDKYRVKLTLTEVMLGTVPKDPEVYRQYIASQAALTDDELAEELASVERVEEKGWTGFRKLEDGTPFMFDYMVKGFLKDACGMLRRVKGTKSKALTAYKKEIDGLVFIEPRKITLDLNGGEPGVLERPLRASTPKGERVSLARSDTVPAGTTLEFEITVMGGNVDEATLREWLDYGAYHGLGQWRNAGYGTFTYEMDVVK